jgi:glycerol transport system ATP-binding protein
MARVWHNRLIIVDDPVLELKNLQLAEGSAPLNFELRDGAVGVVLGRNHSGKTRLARTVAGLDEPVAGRLLLDGEDITDLSPGRRSVGLVYQEFVNYPNLTVAQNIASPLRARGRRRNARVREIAAQLGLSETLQRLPQQLSGGQQQRVAIARALAKNPRVLVLDEPLANLDFKLRESFASELRELMHRQGTAALYTSSDPREAFNLGDVVLLLDNHELIQMGSPLQVYMEPVSELAADLMSDPGINRWRRHGVLHGLRPEQLELQASGPDDLEFVVTLLSIETNGQETFLHVQPAWDEHWVARVDGLPQGLHEGTSISLFALAGSVMTFGGQLSHG